MLPMIRMLPPNWLYGNPNDPLLKFTPMIPHGVTA
jgi:hypothetical protein